MADSKDIRSKFKLEFETKGAEKVKKQVGEVNQALGKKKMTEGMTELERITKRNMRQMAGLSKHLKDVTKSLAGMAKSVKSVSNLADQLKRASKNAKDTGDNVKKTEQAMRRGAFSQGLGQGLGFGPFLQRGPGMKRQAAGMAVGGGIRGLASSPVRGTQALAQGLSSIPGGGIVTAMMSNAIQSVQSAMQQEAGISALGGIPRAEAIEAGKQARSNVLQRGIKAPERSAIRARLGGALAESEAGLEFGQRTGAMTGVISPGEMDLDTGELLGGHAGLTPRQKAAVDRGVQEEIDTRKAALAREAQKAGFAAKRAVLDPHLDPIQRLQSAAADMGIMPQQALQMAEQMGLSTMDPTLRRAGRPGGGIEASMGLQRLGFGGSREAGAFLRAERRGGIQAGGASESANRAIGETLGRGVAMGLERSEIRELLSSIATGQDRFFTTGVPFARRSILDLTEGLGGALGEGLRSMRAAQAIAQGAQAVGGAGPQNAAQAMLIREVARSRGLGFGNEGIFEAMSQMEQGFAPTGSEIEGLMGRFRTGGGFAGAFAKKQIFQGAFPGMQLTAREAGRLGAEGIAGPQTQGAQFDAGAEARRRAPAIETTKARQELMRIGVGQEMAPAVQTFEKAMIKSARGFSKMAPSLKTVADGAEVIASAMPAVTGAIQNFIDAFGDKAEVQKMKDKIQVHGGD